MSRRNRLIGLSILVLVLAGMLAAQAAPAVKTPAEVFGFKPGTDRKLIDYEQLIDYLKMLDAASPRLQMIQIGKSPEGRPMYLAVISSEDNIRNLDRLKEISRRLALDPAIPDSEREALIKEGRVFVMVTLSMHSSEVGPSQAFPLEAYRLVTSQEPDILKQLTDEVLLVVPNHNPDGMDMVVKYYRETLGTKYEGGMLPGLYHKYVGHDNNRDFITLSQSDTQAINRAFSTEWYPQVLLEKHQMGETGPRFFVPPNHDPIAENIEGGMWDWMEVFGANMSRDMGRDNLTGVAHNWMFDNYWPGSAETSLWKNVISMLTEMASCQVATPIYVEPNELSVRGKGLAEYKKSVNMPAPWPGGWWRLSEMMKYELSSFESLARTAARNRETLLRFRNDMCRREVELGQTQAPYYYIIPLQQHDPSAMDTMVNLLLTHGVQVSRLEQDIQLGHTLYHAGDVVVPMAQPYRAFAKEVLEKQTYPVRHYVAGGEVIMPYDITSWSLPLHRGVTATEVEERSAELEKHLAAIGAPFILPGRVGELPAGVSAIAFPANDNASYRAAFTAMSQGVPVSRTDKAVTVAGQTLPAGSFILGASGSVADTLRKIVADMPIAPVPVAAPADIPAHSLTPRRIALVETWFHDMDAGWTRFIFDTYGIPFKVIRPGDFETTDFAADFDVVVFPSDNKDILMSGEFKGRGRYYIPDLPPKYRKGIGAKGMKRLMTFLEQGGIIVSWGQSTELFMGPLSVPSTETPDAEKTAKTDNGGEKFQLPIRDIGSSLSSQGLNVPGSLLAIKLKADHPLTLGMADTAAVFSRGVPVFRTSVPDQDMDRRVIAVFPETDILLSGYAEKPELLADQSAMVWLRKAKGQLVLYTFNPQFRASTQGAYKLLFNALLLPSLK